MITFQQPRFLPAASPHSSWGLLALLVVLCAGSSTSLAAENPHWEKHADKPVEIVQKRDGSSQTLEFVDFEDGKVMASIGEDEGEISMSVSESMAGRLELDLGIMSEVEDLIEDEEYGEALSMLRPKVYPLIKFIKLPEGFKDLHETIQELLKTLIRADEKDEALDLIERIPLEEIDPEYSAIAIVLVNKLLEDGDSEKAAGLAGDIPVTGKYRRNIQSILDAAHKLRGEEQFDKVIPLYRVIEEASPDSMKPFVRMWLAYSLILDERSDEAQSIFESIEPPDPNQRYFSLYKLLQGTFYYKKEQYRDALDNMTRGFVRAHTASAWVPEMLYFIGDCYRQLNNRNAAKNVWKEATVLYPDSPWAEKAETELADVADTADNTENN
ncbi:MAG: tetratricopeptide repeat protein [Opitutales bacterium]